MKIKIKDRIGRCICLKIIDFSVKNINEKPSFHISTKKEYYLELDEKEREIVNSISSLFNELGEYITLSFHSWFANDCELVVFD